MATSRRFPIAMVWAAWTVPALLSTFETVMFMRGGTRPIETWRAFASEAPGWYMWALLTSAIAGLTGARCRQFARACCINDAQCNSALVIADGKHIRNCTVARSGVYYLDLERLRFPDRLRVT